jgi:hypothetical protein
MPRALLEHSYNQTKYSRAQTLQYELVFGPKFVSAGGLNSAKKTNWASALPSTSRVEIK